MALFMRKKRNIVSSEPIKPIGKSNGQLSEHLATTLLDGVLAALPLSCRKMVLDSDGVLAQLALIALMQAEKNKRKLHKTNPVGKKPKPSVDILIKKIKAQLGALSGKVKAVKKKIVISGITHKRVLGGGKLRKHAGRKKIKLFKKDPSKKIKVIKKKPNMGKLLKAKAPKKTKSKNKVKSKAMNKAFIQQKGTIKKANKTVSNKKVSKVKAAIFKGKLTFLTKPDAKAMNSVNKQVLAKERTLRSMKEKQLKKDVKITVEKDPIPKKGKPANARFFKLTQASTSKPAIIKTIHQMGAAPKIIKSNSAAVMKTKK